MVILLMMVFYVVVDRMAILIMIPELAFYAVMHKIIIMVMMPELAFYAVMGGRRSRLSLKRAWIRCCPLVLSTVLLL
jgi:hypothetical protein